MVPSTPLLIKFFSGTVICLVKPPARSHFETLAAVPVPAVQAAETMQFRSI
jgi:hypothetical protein